MIYSANNSLTLVMLTLDGVFLVLGALVCLNRPVASVKAAPVVSAAPDLGADEYPANLPYRVYLPIVLKNS